MEGSPGLKDSLCDIWMQLRTAVRRPGRSAAPMKHETKNNMEHETQDRKHETETS